MDETPKLRVVPGDPWRVEVTHPDGTVDTAVVYDGGEGTDHVLRSYRDPAVPPPHHISMAVKRLGYTMDGYGPLSPAIENGTELPVRPVSRSEAARRPWLESPWILPDLFDETTELSVSLPTDHVADLLRDIRDAMPHCLDPSGVELLGELSARIEAGSTDVTVPAYSAYELAHELRKSPLRGIRAESHGRMELLARLIEEGRPRDPWSAARDALGRALREALARPGAEGIAARDELLDQVRQFANLHQGVTHPDDAEQQRIQTPARVAGRGRLFRRAWRGRGG